MSTAYTIEIITPTDEGPAIELVGIDATSDAAAIRKLRTWLDDNGHDLPPDSEAFLKFFRSSDGQRGYLNPDGASPTGSPWPLKKNRAAVALGRKGGKAATGAKGFATMTPEKIAAAQLKSAETKARNNAAKKAALDV